MSTRCSSFRSPARNHWLRAIPATVLLAGFAALPCPGASGPHPDFQKHAVSFIEKHCRECHGGKSTKADLNLVKLDRSDAAILKNRKVWMNVLTQVGAGEMPPKKQARPSLPEIEQFTRAVESAFERAEATMPLDPGRVTVRRLNRNEYHNTVRDLLRVDFNPTESFPADDIGHGFDNIGDVLTLSPLLMERYLDAAETIAQRVLVEKPPKPGVRYLSGRYLQPNNAQTPQDRFRPMDPTATEAVKSGPFAAGGDYLKLTGNAELLLRATLYAEPRGTAPVKVALFIHGPKLAETSSDAEVDKLAGAGLAAMRPMKILKIFEITARAGKPQTIEVPVNRIEGIARAGVAVLKPQGGEEPAKLFIEHIWSEGPLETRPESQMMLMAGLAGKPQAQQTRELLTKLLTRAYRRPVTPKELEAMTRLVEQTIADGRTWEAGIQRAIVATLCSPKFLFRVELDDRPETRQPHAIDDFQLASRLSYFLWSTMPDAELFALAEKRQLSAQLDAQIKRMLQDPKATALVDNFALQWLQLKRLQTFAPDTKLFPAFNDGLRRAMFRETELFFAEIVREDRSVLDLIDADYTYLNEPLARHYGIADTAGNRAGTPTKSKLPGGKPFVRDTFTRVSLPQKERGGLLYQASVLTVTSNPTRTSPVKRGRWVLEQLLGTPPPPPPPNVPELEAQNKLTGTLRQRMEQHRANAACASCHAQMDALGFGLENFDAIGAWRAKDGEEAIDASGTLPDGKSFNGPADLKAVLKDKKELFTRNLAEQLLTYALGRGLEYYDSRAIRQITSQVAKQDHKFSALVTAIVKSDPFRLRRGKDLAEPPTAAR
ncbi:MAG: hypothetical protein B9S33_02950 [Pedosphaera sp. Tous-C6FEB]|nr:MAG: hypothetical protein B9S33_02950 [Pedosphaera sp. Tous-C6FEB]